MNYNYYMMGIICSKAIHNVKLRESSLFTDNPMLSEAILVAIVHFIYVLYDPDSSTYYYITADNNGYTLLLKEYITTKLSLDQIVNTVETKLKENIDA